VEVTAWHFDARGVYDVAACTGRHPVAENSRSMVAAARASSVAQNNTARRDNRLALDESVVVPCLSLLDQLELTVELQRE
jgi:hypothetical protein